ncbi:MAG: sodium:solute symporter family protein [Sedimentisphaerales bacterium]
MTILDYGIIVAYLLFSLIIGIVYSRKASQSPEHYFLGGRSMPWWMISISLMATSFASDTPLVVTEITRQFGLQRMWWVFTAVLTLIVGIFLFSRLWRRSAIITDAEFYELRYDGKSAAFLRGFRAFYSGIIQNLVVIAWVTFAMSNIITIMTPLNKVWAVGTCIVVALIYTTFSGFYGVVITDVVQFFIASGSMIILAFIAVYKVGGLQNVLTTIAATPGYEKTLSIFPDFKHFDLGMLKLLIYAFVLWWADAGGYNMQRISGCRNERHAVLATLFYAIFQSIRPWMWIPVALVSIVLFPHLTGTQTDTQAYPLVANKYLGIGLKGLLVSGFLAAFMSTITTQLNWGASYIMTDVYKRFIRKDASHRRYMIVTRIVVVVLMVGAAAIVPLLKSVTAAWEFLAFMTVGSGIICVARWFWWRVNAYTEITALALGLVAGLSNPFISNSVVVFGYPWQEMPFEVKIALLTGIIIPISILVTFLTPAVSKEKLEAFYRKIRPGGFWGIVSKEARNLPGKALNAGTFIDVIGGILLCYGLSLSIGYCILLKFGKAAVCFGCSVVGAVWVFRWFKKEVRELEEWGVFREHHIETAQQGDLQQSDSGVKKPGVDD